MYKNRPIVSTAKVRGMIKRNGINYVDASGIYFPSIYSGIHVWQLCSNVYFKVVGSGSAQRIEENLEKFAAVLDAEGLAYVVTNNRSYQIVKKA